MTFHKSIFVPALLASFLFSTFGAAQTNIFAEDPLIVAVYENRTDKVRELIIRQHPMARTDTEGRTAMIWGAIQGSYEALELILEADAQTNLIDEIDNSALYYAANNGHDEVVQLLLSYKANINRENRDGRTPLMAAANQGHARVVAALIAGGADVGVSDFTGRTALDLAREGRSRKVVQLLEQAGGR